MPPVGEVERDLSEQLLETWMLLEFCDQGNLEAAARDSRFKNDFVSTCPPVLQDFNMSLGGITWERTPKH